MNVHLFFVSLLKLKVMDKKYKGYKIESIPSEKFPNLVSITRGKLFKRFINEFKACAWIDAELANRLIEDGNEKTKLELEETVVISD